MYYNKETEEFDIPELKLDGDAKCIKVSDPQAYAEEGCAGCPSLNGCVPFQ